MGFPFFFTRWCPGENRFGVEEHSIDASSCEPVVESPLMFRTRVEPPVAHFDSPLELLRKPLDELDQHIQVGRGERLGQLDRERTQDLLQRADSLQELSQLTLGVAQPSIVSNGLG